MVAPTVPTPETAMTVEQLHTMIGWVVGTGLGVVGILGSAMLFCGRYVMAIVKRISSQLTQSMTIQGRLIRTMIEMAQTISSQEQREAFAQKFLDLYSSFVEDSLAGESASKNPLTAGELVRLRGYYVRVKSGEWLTEEEATDFADLAGTLEKDRESKGQTDIGAIVLAGVAGFVLGAILGSKGN